MSSAVWDAMRVVAAQRYAAGEMPDWFSPEMLNSPEAPANAAQRELSDQFRLAQEQGREQVSSKGRSAT